MKNIMVFAPHMDDELIGCGGSILRHLEAGHSIRVVYFTDGSFFLDDKIKRDQYVRRRRDESLAVCNELGVSYCLFDIPDRTLTYNGDVVKMVNKQICTFCPDIVYIPHADEGDKEHRIVNEIVMEACWLAYTVNDIENAGRINRIKTILEYEVWTPLSYVDHINDISQYVDRKRSLIELYESQVHSIKYQDAAIALNRYRGIMHLHKDCYAEAFRLRKMSQSIDGQLY